MNYTTSNYLEQLQQDREDLVDNLETQGIDDLTGDETFTELVPRVLDIQTGGGGTITLQSKTVTPTTSQQVISADSGYDGLDEVTISAVTNSIDNNIVASNIKNGVSILGVTGTYTGLDTSDATATAADIASGKTAYANGTKLTGTLENDFDKFLQGTLAVGGKYENPRITSMPNGMFSGSSFDSFNNVISFPNLTIMGYSTFYPASNITGLELPELVSNTTASYIIMNCTKLKYIYAPKWIVACSGPMRGNTLCETIDFNGYVSGRELGSYAFQNLTSLTKMIIRGDNLIPMTSKSNNLYSSPLFSGNGCLYVKPDLVNTYKSATNWSEMAARIYPLYIAESAADITTKLNDSTIPVGSLIIYDGGTYSTNRYTVKTGGN